MALTAEALQKTFLPPTIKWPVNPLPARIADKPLARRPGSDREGPIVQRDRALGDYGWKLIEAIAKDYSRNIDRRWKPAFAEVVGAFATAIENRNTTVRLAEEERAREAARAAAFYTVVLSLLTAGAMRFLGAYIQYSLLPSIVNSKWVQAPINPITGANVGKILVMDGPRFSQIQAAAFGGIVQDLGNKLIPLTFPKPKTPSYQLDSLAGVMNMNADFLKLLDDSASLVLGQFDEVQKWMNEDTTFGSAWATFADGNEEHARTYIRQHIDKVRRKWAVDWEFFGTVPNAINRRALSERYERSLWASYVVSTLGPIREKKRGTLYHDREIRQKTLMEEAIVKRLMLLNVTMPETVQDMIDQTARIVFNGAPGPTVDVGETVDSMSELIVIYDWARAYLRNAGSEAERQFFPTAGPRALPSL
jgi:hypothetical protein